MRRTLGSGRNKWYRALATERQHGHRQHLSVDVRNRFAEMWTDAKGAYIPSPEEIERKCREIRDGWTDEERLQREQRHPERVFLRHYRVARHLGCMVMEESEP